MRTDPDGNGVASSPKSALVKEEGSWVKREAVGIEDLISRVLSDLGRSVKSEADVQSISHDVFLPIVASGKSLLERSEGILEDLNSSTDSGKVGDPVRSSGLSRINEALI
jgi:hypothetical protein